MGFLFIEYKQTNSAVFIQDGRQGSNIRILVHQDPIPRRPGKLEDLPEFFLSARENSQSRRDVRIEVFFAEPADFVKILFERFCPFFP
jgi:hypothetical protein